MTDFKVGDTAQLTAERVSFFTNSDPPWQGLIVKVEGIRAISNIGCIYDIVFLNGVRRGDRTSFSACYLGPAPPLIALAMEAE